MALSILPPVLEEPIQYQKQSYEAEYESDESMDDNDDRPSKRIRLSHLSSHEIAVPGEKITDDTQWMR